MESPGIWGVELKEPDADWHFGSYRPAYSGCA
jgi:hypothetical protein